MTGRRALPLVLLLWVAGLGAAAQFAKVAVVLPEFAALYPGAGAAVGWLVSLISAVGLVFGLVAGSLAGGAGLKRLLVASLALGAAMSLLQSLAPPFPLMLALRTVEGASHLGVVVTAPTLIAAYAPDRWRGAAMTLWGTFFGVAFAATAWAGVPLVRAQGVGALLLAHGVYMAACAAILLLALPGDEPDGAPLAWRGLLARHARAYASPTVSAPAWGWLFYTFTFVALATVLPTLVAPDARVLVAGAMPVASIAVSMTLGVVLLRYTSAVGVVMIGFAASLALAAWLLAGAGDTVVGAAVEAAVPVALPIVLFGALGLVQGASFAAVPQLNATPADRALANGAMAQTGNAGNLLGTPVLLATLGAGGTGAMFAVVIAAYAIGLAIHLVAARARG